MKNKTEPAQTISELTLGDRVSFVERKTKQEKKGSITKFNKHKEVDYAFVMSEDKSQWVSCKKLIKI